MKDNIKILIVDDDLDAVELLTKRFRAEGYSTSEAYDGGQALQKVKEYKPDLIILDIMMPKVDGYEVSKSLKNYDETKHIPIIMLSAKAKIPDKVKGLDFGADDYITKPFDYRELSQRVKYWVAVKVGVEERLNRIQQLEKELIQSERLAAIGQTVASLAHYVKNILFGLKGGLYLANIAIKQNDTDSLKSSWDILENNMGRISDLVLDLVEYSKEREPEFEKCSPNKIADDVCELMKESAKEYDIEIVKNFTSSTDEIFLDPKAIHRCLLNLISNAIDACAFDVSEKEKWQITVSTNFKDDGAVIFQVSDNGLGMGEEVKSKLFTSFFSTKRGKGTGLGLLNTKKVVNEHGGTIDIESNPGKGSTFTITIPKRDLKG